jgi:hypothetical protein
MMRIGEVIIQSISAFRRFDMPHDEFQLMCAGYAILVAIACAVCLYFYLQYRRELRDYHGKKRD